MTRKEEIKQASIDYQMSIHPMAIGGNMFEDLVRSLNINPSFIAGAEWADQTMLDKVCEWLKDHWMYSPDEIGTEHRDWFIDQFRKAMEQ